MRCQDRDAVRVRELRSGLWTWTGRHPAWTPADGGPDGWEQEVACVYYEGPHAVVLFDPLVPMEDRDRFYEALDRDVERAGKPVRILLTVDAHVRSAEELAKRYGTEAPEPPPAVPELPAGVELAAEAAGELVFWLPEHATLVAGDLIVGRDGGLWIPRPWLERGDRYDEAIERLRPVLELPVELVLPGHGEPVLAAGREALAAALEA
jgi:glyoxylase-like metal-dependent hydrolase (beta-lactamase superfamily II)